MTNSKQTKKALLSSVIALILCLSMLIGTTFAWFTDSVSSDLNEIKAGNLDVELYHSDKNDKGYVKNDTKLFNDVTQWEPGVVVYENFVVENKGSLALKYQLGIVFDKATDNGNGGTLADVLKVAVVKDGFSGDRADAHALWSNGETDKVKFYDLSTFILSGELEGDEKSNTYGVVIYWEPTDKDNDFNMNNGKTEVLSIELGVGLYATQEMYENDSFGDDYDENAWVNGFKVYTAQDLQAAINAGEQNIVLMDDIEIIDGPIVIPASATAYSVRSNAVVIDLNGKSITTKDVQNVYAINNLGNLKIVDTAGGGSVNARGIYNGYDNGGEYVATANLVVEGGTFNAKGTNGGAAVYNYGTVTINGGKFTSVGGYSLNNQAGAVLTINNAEVTGGIFNSGALTINNGIIQTNRGGYTHAVFSQGGSLVINDGSFSGNGNEVVNANEDTAIINGGTFQKVEKTSYLMAGKNMVINGGNFLAHESNPAGHPVRPDVTVKGGTFNYNHKNVADGYKSVDVDGKFYVVPENAVASSEDLQNAIANAAEGDTILVAAGEYALRFTNDTSFNVDTLTIKGLGEVKLAISSSEVGYGRIQGNDVTFENINFVNATVGATGKATYNNCTFAGRLECASGSAETYANDCTMDNVHTSGDMSAGNAYFTGCTMNSAVYAKPTNDATLTFEDCTIGELLTWNANTTLINCKVEKLDLSKVTTAVIMIDGLQWVADGLYKDPATEANDWYVDNAEGLANLNAKMADKTLGQYAEIYLMNDIDFAGKTWTPVDSHADSAFFFNVFDGQGHTIKNLTINGQAMFTRFAGLGDVDIKDLTFDGANVNSNGKINTSILTVQTYQSVLLDNVDVKNSSISGGYKVAPLIATVYNEKDTSITATLKNCDVSDTTVTATKYDFGTCGLVSFAFVTDNDYVEYENCSITNVALKAVSGGYNYHANIHYTSADTDDQINEHPQVKVTNVTFESIG